MKNLGYDDPLYILPFDHRSSFELKMFGWGEDLTPERTAQIAAAKQVIYDGFRAAVEAGAPKEKAGILVDEQFGSLTCGRRRSLARTPWPRLRAATASLWAFLKTSAPRLALREGERLAEWETMQ